MGEVIEFPADTGLLFRREMERLLDGSLRVSDPDVRECIKTSVAEILAKYEKPPSIRLSVQIAISEADTAKLVNALSAAYKEQVVDYVRGLLFDLCLLQAKLCKCEHGKQQKAR